MNSVIRYTFFSVFLFAPALTVATPDLVTIVSKLEKRVEYLELKLEALEMKQQVKPKVVKSIGEYVLSDEAKKYRDQVLITDFEMKMIKQYPSAIFKMKNNGNRDIKVLVLTAYFLDQNGQRVQEFFIPVISPRNKTQPLFKAGYLWEAKEGLVYQYRGKTPSEWIDGSAEYEITYIEFSD